MASNTWPGPSKKSDHADTVTLANILRTDTDQHRRLPADTKLAQSINRAGPCASGRHLAAHPGHSHAEVRATHRRNRLR